MKVEPGVLQHARLNAFITFQLWQACFALADVRRKIMLLAPVRTTLLYGCKRAGGGIQLGKVSIISLS